MKINVYIHSNNFIPSTVAILAQDILSQAILTQAIPGIASSMAALTASDADLCAARASIFRAVSAARASVANAAHAAHDARTARDTKAKVLSANAFVCIADKALLEYHAALDAYHLALDIVNPLYDTDITSENYDEFLAARHAAQIADTAQSNAWEEYYLVRSFKDDM